MKTYLALIVSLFFTQLCIGQTITNPGLEGSGSSYGTSINPIGWQSVPYTDAACFATAISGFDSPDLTSELGPSYDINGTPFEGNSFVSGLYLTFTDNANNLVYTWHEGIQQTLNDLIIGTTYTLTFHQAVVKQNDCRDESGGWSFYLDDTFMTNTAVSVNSSLSPFDINLNWEERSVSFIATNTSHTIKFMPFDDENNQESSDTDITGGLRMGIDAFILSSECSVDINLGNDLALCTGDSVILNAENIGSTYLWNDNSTAQTLTVNQTGTYWVTATINDCTDSDTIHISFQSPQINFTDSASGCSPLIVNFTPTTNDSIYSWNWDFGDGNTSSSQEGNNTYLTNGSFDVSLTVTDSLGCETSLLKPNYITTFPTPVIDLGIDVTLCANETYILDALNQGADYLWNNNSIEQSITVTQSGTYWVTAFINGCSDTDTITINFNSPTIDFSDSTFGCAPLTVDFTPITNDSITNWTWDFGDSSTSNESNPSHVFENQGSYSVSLTVSDDYGCEASTQKTDYITVYPSVNATFNYTQNAQFTENQDVIFTDESSGNPINWSWYINQNNVNNNSSFSYNFETVGNYVVQLYVENEFGCTDSITSVIQIEAPGFIYVPNAFTPDGDQMNNIFKAEGVEINTFNLLIFNRWGELIFESNNIDYGWNGNYMGKNAPTGVYTWKIVYNTNNDDTNQELIGHVTLLR